MCCVGGFIFFSMLLSYSTGELVMVVKMTTTNVACILLVLVRYALLIINCYRVLFKG